MIFESSIKGQICMLNPSATVSFQSLKKEKVLLAKNVRLVSDEWKHETASNISQYEIKKLGS